MSIKKIGIVVAAAVVLLAMTACNALADNPVPLKHNLVSEIIDNDGTPSFSAIWLTHYSENITVPANGYLLENCTWFDMSNNIIHCDTIYNAVCNGGLTNTYYSQTYPDSLPATFNTNFTQPQQVQVGLVSGNYTYNAVECYYPWGSGYIFNPNPMQNINLRIS